MWRELKNSDFKNFNIENIIREDSFYKDKFYVTDSTLFELKKFFDCNKIENDYKLQYLNYLLTSNKVLDDIEQATKVLLKFNNALSCNTLIGQNRFVSSKYTFGFLGDSTLPEINDGIMFEEKNLIKEVGDKINFKNTEEVLFYKKTNLLGECEGYIFTNYRIVSLQTKNGTYSLYWKEIRNIRKKLFGTSTINEKYELPLNEIAYKIVESMIDYEFIKYPIIIRGEKAFSGKFGILSFDRYTYEQFETLQKELELFEKEENKKNTLFLYSAKSDTKIPIQEKKLIINKKIIGKIEKHPKKKGFILRNLSSNSWDYFIENKQYTIEPSQARALIVGSKIIIDKDEFKVIKEE